MKDVDFTIYNPEDEEPQVQPEEQEVQAEKGGQQEPEPEDNEEGEEEGKDTNKRKWNSLLIEGEDDESQEEKKIHENFAQTYLNPKWFMHQMPLLIIILGGLMLLVTNRYKGQQDLIEKAKLEDEVEDWRFRALTRSSELTELTRQSHIEELLKSRHDTTLVASPEPPFTLNPDK